MWFPAKHHLASKHFALTVTLYTPSLTFLVWQDQLARKHAHVLNNEDGRRKQLKEVRWRKDNQRQQANDPDRANVLSGSRSTK